MKRGRLARALLSVLATALLLGWAARSVDLTETVRLFGDVHPGWALLAVALGPVQIGLAGLRWRAALAGSGRSIGVGRAIGEVGLSTVLNQVLPGGIAGDGVRVWRERQGGWVAPLQAALVDRWVGLWVHLGVTVVATAIAVRSGASSAWTLAAIVGLGAAWTGLVAFPGERGRLVRTGLGQTGVTMVALSAAMTGTFVVAFAACGAALGVPFGPWVAVVPLVLLAMALPLSVGGWGLREVAAIAVLPRLGWTDESALAVSSLYGLCSFVGSLPGLLALGAGGQR